MSRVFDCAPPSAPKLSSDAIAWKANRVSAEQMQRDAERNFARLNATIRANRAPFIR